MGENKKTQSWRTKLNIERIQINKQKRRTQTTHQTFFRWSCCCILPFFFFYLKQSAVSAPRSNQIKATIFLSRKKKIQANKLQNNQPMKQFTKTILASTDSNNCTATSATTTAQPPATPIIFVQIRDRNIIIWRGKGIV